MPPDQPQPPPQPKRLEFTVPLVLGMMSFEDKDGHRRRCTFQFNPAQLERSRTIQITRSPTGNTLEEPGAGPRNQPKRKMTRKPQPWDMTLSLRYDASYPSQNPAPDPDEPLVKDKVEFARQFFEALVEPGGFQSEDTRIANANETAPPPLVLFQYGERAWECAVKSLRIKEEDYTYDLYPRRFEVTITLEIIGTVPRNNAGKLGGLV